MAKREYRIELEGFNDGLCYEQSSYDNKAQALLALRAYREKNAKVRYRLIEVIEDFS